jgi:lipoyl(octanoyl) transferase
MPDLVDWGRRDYAESLAAMHALVAERRAGTIDDTLVLVEHPPVVTVGVEGDDGAAWTLGLPVVRVERGGRATYHAPGQLVGYPIVDLAPRGRDVRRFVHDVEESLVRALSEFGVRGAHVPGRRGVWVDGERKIASVGIAVEGWVTYHGFALNVDLDLTPFTRFHPCGFDAPVMTSIARETGASPPMPEVKEAVVRSFRAVLARPGRATPDAPSTAGFPSTAPA